MYPNAQSLIISILPHLLLILFYLGLIINRIIMGKNLLMFLIGLIRLRILGEIASHLNGEHNSFYKNKFLPFLKNI